MDAAQPACALGNGGGTKPGELWPAERVPAADVAQVLGDNVNLGLALVLEYVVVVILFGIQQVTAVNGAGLNGRQDSVQSGQVGPASGKGGNLPGTPLHLVLNHHGTLGQGLTYRTVPRRPLQPHPFRSGDVALQRNLFPHAESDGTGPFDGFNLKVNFNVFQFNAATVGHAYHRNHRSSGPGGHRQVLGRGGRRCRRSSWECR